VGWQAIFFVNVPVGIAVLVLAPIVIRESKLEVARRRYDPLGALAITGSIVLLVYSISKAPSVGWGTGRTIGGLAASVVLFALFLFLESRVAEPLMPLSIWRLRTVTTGNVVGAVCGSVMFSTFFLLTLYMQDVLGYSALQTGMGILCTAIASIAFAIVAEALVTRLGPKVVLGAGLALMGVSLVWFAQFPVHGRYWVDLFGPFVILGIGAGFSFVPVSIIALAGVPGREQGLASGLMNTSQQVGGAVGLAVAATIFTTRFSHELPHLVSQGVGAAEAAPRALVSGFTLAYWVLAIIAFAGCAATILLLRGVELADESATEPVVDTHVVSPFCFNRAATSAISTMVLGDATPETPRSMPT
jgi:MFS family permease